MAQTSASTYLMACVLDGVSSVGDELCASETLTFTLCTALVSGPTHKTERNENDF